MEVILLERVRNLGNLGDKVQVKAGYGRNFLIPQKKAVSATNKNLELFEERRAELEKKANDTLTEAQKRADTLNSLNLVIEALASDEGKLYGSVGVNEISEALTKQGCEVSKREIVMPEGPIHTIGAYTVEVHVHSDVIATLNIEITPSK